MTADETGCDGIDGASQRDESGVYFVRLETEDSTTYQKATLLR